MEVQALEAIYGDDFKHLDAAASDGGAPPPFEVTLVPEAGAGEEVNHVSVALRIQYTPTYPEAPPEVGLRVVRRGGLMDEQVSECEAELREAAQSEELLGTAMVYMLAEKATEWLVAHNKPEMDMHAEMMERLRAEQSSGAAADDAVDVGDGEAGAGAGMGRGKRGKRGGAAGDGTQGSWRVDAEADRQADLLAGCTPVTVETFAEFRKEWEAQRLAKKAAAVKAAGGARNRASADDGLTGRQLFERGDASLIAGDAGALEDGELDVSAMRETEDGGGEGGDEGGEGAAGVDDASVLEAVGNLALFEEDEEDLPSDED